MGKKHSKFSVITVTILNTAIILGVVWWSGTVRDKNLYDRYRLTLDSIVFVVNNIETSSEFYSKVLNFSPNKESDNSSSSSFQLPDGQRIFLVSKTQNQFSKVVTNIFSRPNAVVLNLRNRLEEFHEIMVVRSGKEALTLEDMSSALQKPTPQRVSQIIDQPWGKEFIVTDPDGNLFVFYSGKSKKSRWSLK